jgi:RNA polymerase sigma-70 factor (ECF subfamily)
VTRAAREGAREDVRDGVSLRLVVPPPLTLEDIYRGHFDFVWRTLRRLGVREEDAKDAAQEVFIVVHRKLPEFAGRSKVTTWLYGICFRVASERRRARQTTALAPDAVAALPSPDRDPGAAAEHHEGLRVLEQILERLPDEQRAVFCLFELEGTTCERIAELVGIPLGTVYSRLRLARAAFENAASALLDQRVPRLVTRGRTAS